MTSYQETQEVNHNPTFCKSHYTYFLAQTQTKKLLYALNIRRLLNGEALVPLVVPVHHNYIHSGFLCGPNYNLKFVYIFSEVIFWPILTVHLPAGKTVDTQAVKSLSSKRQPQ